jgi:hypothetical protein
MHTTLQHPTLRRSRLRLPVLLGLVLAFALAACSSTSATRIGRERPGSSGQGQLVDIGGRHLYLACQGTGTPTVVFVARARRQRRDGLADGLGPGGPLGPRLHLRPGRAGTQRPRPEPCDLPGRRRRPARAAAKRARPRPLPAGRALPWRSADPAVRPRPASARHRNRQPGLERGAARRRSEVTEAGQRRGRPATHASKE